MKHIGLCGILTSGGVMIKLSTTGTLLCVCFILLFAPSISRAQLILGPESVEFDEARNRYLVSNWNNGTIVAIDSMGVQSYFITGIN
jgi:hypothetical protein